MFNHLLPILKSVIEGPIEILPNSPNYFSVYRALAKHPTIRRMPGGWLYEGEFWPDYLCVGGASHAIFPIASRFCKGRGIDVGAGYWPFPGAIPVDPNFGKGTTNTLGDFQNNSLDYVFSSHCLEHIEDPLSELGAWINLLRYDGIIFLYLPHERCSIWRKGSPFVGEGHKWIPTFSFVQEMFHTLGITLIDGSPDPDAMWSFFIVGEKHRGQSTSNNLQHPTH